MPGGGKVHGPVPRDYEYSLPKAVRRLALIMALKHVASQDGIKIWNVMETSGKTREFASKLKQVSVGRCLVVAPNELVARSARNIPNVKVLKVEGLNVFDLLKYGHLWVTENLWMDVVKRLGG